MVDKLRKFRNGIQNDISKDLLEGAYVIKDVEEIYRQKLDKKYAANVRKETIDHFNHIVIEMTDIKYSERDLPRTFSELKPIVRGKSALSTPIETAISDNPRKSTFPSRLPVMKEHKTKLVEARSKLAAELQDVLAESKKLKTMLAS